MVLGDVRYLGFASARLAEMGIYLRVEHKRTSRKTSRWLRWEDDGACTELGLCSPGWEVRFAFASFTIRILDCLCHQKSFFGGEKGGWQSSSCSWLAALDLAPVMDVCRNAASLRRGWGAAGSPAGAGGGWCWAGSGEGVAPAATARASYWLLGQFQWCLKRVGSILSARHPVFPATARALEIRWGASANT